MQFIEALDQGAHPWFLLQHRSWLDPIVVSITHLGSKWVLVPVVLGVTGWLVLGRRQRAALIFVMVAITGSVLENATKTLVRRPRPEVVAPLVPIPTSFSYPSGHALNATAIYVTAALLLATMTHRRGWRVLLVTPCLLLAYLIGLSRLYLGVHYFSDVAGGWAAGLTLALCGRLLCDRWEKRGPTPYHD